MATYQVWYEKIAGHDTIGDCQLYEADRLWNKLLKDCFLALLMWPPESQKKLILSFILSCFEFFMISFVGLIMQVYSWENVH